MKQDFSEQFKIICRKCGKEPKVVSESASFFDDGGNPGHLEITCECGNEENIWI